MNPVSQAVNIDTLASGIVGEVQICGAMHQVRQPNAGQFKRAAALQDGGASGLAIVVEACALVQELVPTLTTEEVDSLNADQLMVVVLFAGGGIAAVEALYPNAVGPDGIIPPPASSPDSPSSTSSTVSP